MARFRKRLKSIINKEIRVGNVRKVHRIIHTVVCTVCVCVCVCTRERYNKCVRMQEHAQERQTYINMKVTCLRRNNDCSLQLQLQMNWSKASAC